jgi:hypothetical protein
MSLLPAIQPLPPINYDTNPFKIANSSNTQYILGTTLGVLVSNATNGLELGDEKLNVFDTTTDPPTLVASLDPLHLIAIAPNIGTTTLCINQTIFLENDDTIPTRTMTMSVGDPAVVGERFGMTYNSTTNDTFQISTSSSAPILLNQVGGTATTDFLLLHPSQINLEATDTGEILSLSKGAVDLYNTLGNSSVLIDNTHIHLNEPAPTNTPYTTDITYQNIILQSQNITTPNTITTTIQPAVIQQSSVAFDMMTGYGTYSTQDLVSNYISTLTPNDCRLGYDGSVDNGNLRCFDIQCGNNINLLTINGSSYPPVILNENYYFDFQSAVCGDGLTTLFPTATYIPAGLYTITFTIFFEGLVGAGMINCYADLFSLSYGNVFGTARNAGYYPATMMSVNAGYQTCITYMDRFNITGGDFYNINFLQNNMSGWGFGNNTYISGSIVRTN